ncbi:hypothetical protein [Streptomyces sp. NPDC057740]|uniref:hypothetical protein n=1 Tax=Streptomyces sp. NPDC057740 TaxID=3346234 RepID=UPI00368B1F3D
MQLGQRHEVDGVAARLAVHEQAVGATVLLIGLNPHQLSLTTDDVVRRQLTLRGTMIYDHPGDFAAATAELPDARPGAVIEARFPLDRAQQAFTGAAERAGRPGSASKATSSPPDGPRCDAHAALLLRGIPCRHVTSCSLPRLVHQRSQHAESSSARTIASAASPPRPARAANSSSQRRCSPITVSRTTAITGTRLAAANRHAAQAGPWRTSRTVVQASPALVAM